MKIRTVQDTRKFSAVLNVYGYFLMKLTDQREMKLKRTTYAF